MSTYYKEIFEYRPIQMFLDSSVANSITNNGDVNFTIENRNTQTFTLTPKNYTVTSFLGMTVSYSDITNKFKLMC